MSKKNKGMSEVRVAQPALAGSSQEHGIIKHDLIRILILNVVYLAGILALYFTNLHKNYLYNWLDRYIHF